MLDINRMYVKMFIEICRVEIMQASSVWSIARYVECRELEGDEENPFSEFLRFMLSVGSIMCLLWHANLQPNKVGWITHLWAPSEYSISWAATTTETKFSVPLAPSTYFFTQVTNFYMHLSYLISKALLHSKNECLLCIVFSNREKIACVAAVGMKPDQFQYDWQAILIQLLRKVLSAAPSQPTYTTHTWTFRLWHIDIYAIRFSRNVHTYSITSCIASYNLLYMTGYE